MRRAFCALGTAAFAACGGAGDSTAPQPQGPGPSRLAFVQFPPDSILAPDTTYDLVLGFAGESANITLTLTIDDTALAEIRTFGGTFSQSAQSAVSIPSLAYFHVRFKYQTGQFKLRITATGVSIADSVVRSLTPLELNQGFNLLPSDTAVYAGEGFTYRYEGMRAGRRTFQSPVLSTDRPDCLTIQSRRITPTKPCRARIITRVGLYAETVMVSVPPIGQIIANGPASFYLVDLNGRNRRQLASATTLTGEAASWIDRERFIVYGRTQPSDLLRLYVVDTLGAFHRLVTDSTGAPTVAETDPAIVADGSWVYFSGTEQTGPTQQRREIWRVRLDGSHLELFGPTAATGVFDYKPAPSPSGSTLAVETNRPSPNPYPEIQILDTLTRQLTSIGVVGHSPAWSPLGADIAYLAGNGFTGALTLMAADGSNKRDLVVEYRDYFSWSRDGKYVIGVAQTGVAGVYILIVTDVQTGELMPLEFSRGSVSHPAWRP